VLCDRGCDEPCQEKKNIYLSSGMSQGVFSEVAKELRSNLEGLSQSPGPMTFASAITPMDFKDGWMDRRLADLAT